MCRLIVGGFTFITFIFMVTLSTAENIEPGDHLIELENTFAVKKNDVNTLSVFVYHHEHVTWHMAVKLCIVGGAELVTPEDETEAKAVTDWVSRFSQGWAIWTGIEDLQNSGVYRILDGRLLNETDLTWAKDEPFTNGGSNLCVVMQWAKLYPSNCGLVSPYVCKYRFLDSPTKLPPQ